MMATIHEDVMCAGVFTHVDSGINTTDELIRSRGALTFIVHSQFLLVTSLSHDFWVYNRSIMYVYKTKILIVCVLHYNVIALSWWSYY